MKKATIIILVILVLAGVAFAVYMADDKSPSDIMGAPDAKQDETQQAEEQKQQTEDTQEEPNETSSGNVGSNGDEKEETSSKTEADITISNISQDKSMVYVNATVEDATEGTCTAIFSKEGHSNIKESSELQLVTSYYACQTEVSKQEFPVKGMWRVKVKFSSQNAQGVSDVETINIE